MADKLYTHDLNDRGKVDSEFINVYQELKSVSGSAGVSSFNTRVGVVIPASGDYTQNDITNLNTSDSPTFNGLTLNGLTGNELIASNGSKTLQSLAVATYPSLTEVSYVKGVTSAIQTQIGTKLDATRGNWKIFYSDGSGVFQELSLGVANTVLTSNGIDSAPSFITASAGGSGVGFDAIFMMMGA